MNNRRPTSGAGSHSMNSSTRRILCTANQRIPRDKHGVTSMERRTWPLQGWVRVEYIQVFFASKRVCRMISPLPFGRDVHLNMGIPEICKKLSFALSFSSYHYSPPDNSSLREAHGHFRMLLAKSQDFSTSFGTTARGGQL